MIKTVFVGFVLFQSYSIVSSCDHGFMMKISEYFENDVVDDDNFPIKDVIELNAGFEEMKGMGLLMIQIRQML